MTTTSNADSTRADAAAILRAVADLIEDREDIPVPGNDISFYVRGGDAPATMAAIADALPCQWRAEVSCSGEYEWLYLRSGPASVLRGTRVSISAPWEAYQARWCLPSAGRRSAHVTRF